MPTTLINVDSTNETGLIQCNELQLSFLSPYWQIFGTRPIYGKFIQSKFMGTYPVLFKFRLWAGKISGKLIQSKIKLTQFYNFGARHRLISGKIMDEFSRNRSSSCGSQAAAWVMFQKLNRYSQKIGGWFLFRNRPAHNLKIEISKIYWISLPGIGLCHFRTNFPGFANKE